MAKSTQNWKSKFRNSTAWKKFRKEVYHYYKGIDPITRKKLYAGYNTHHMDLNPDHYKDLSNMEHFVPLNKKTHDFIHWLYDYWIKDPEILDRIVQLLTDMREINNGGEI